MPSMSPWVMHSSVVVVIQVVRASSAMYMRAIPMRCLRGREVSESTSCHAPVLTKARMARAKGSVTEDAMSWIVSSQVSSVVPLMNPARARESSRFRGVDPALRALNACLGSLWIRARNAASVTRSLPTRS